MEVALRHVEKLFKNSEITDFQFDLSDLKFANSFKIDSKELNFQTYIDSYYLEQLKEKKINKVSIVVDKFALNKFRNLFPGEFPHYQFEEAIFQVRKRLKFVGKMNAYSKVQRSLVLKQEIIKTTKNKKSILIKVGTPLTEGVLKKIEALEGENYKIQCSYNEEGILLFMDDPVKNVMLRIDILALLSKANYPIHYCETLDEALQVFTKERPKVVVMTHLEKAWETKAFFLECLNKDPFLKYINYDSSPTKNRDVEFERLVELYDDDYEDILENFLIAKSHPKPNLEGKMRNPIMDKLNIIRNNYNKKHYYEMKYYLYKLGKKYNVKTLENILSAINS